MKLEVRPGGGAAEGAGVGAVANAQERDVWCQSVLPSSPLPAPYPVLRLSAGLQVCRSPRCALRSGRLEQIARRGPGRGKGGQWPGMGCEGGR